MGTPYRTADDVRPWGVSDTFLRLIPTDPMRVPTATARESAEHVLRQALPLADEVISEVTDDVKLVDCGADFETVNCPRCGTDLGEWWSVAMEAVHEEHFRDLRGTLPCCGRRVSLNDLDYRSPMGFARYTLEALNPGVGKLPERIHNRLEEVLGTPVRVIWAHM